MAPYNSAAARVCSLLQIDEIRKLDVVVGVVVEHQLLGVFPEFLLSVQNLP